MHSVLVGPDGAGGAADPGGQLDVLAVQQGQLAAGVERGGGGQHRLADRLAPARLPADQHVALDQRHGDELAVLIQPDRDRRP
jgi:hypothetical protein